MEKQRENALGSHFAGIDGAIAVFLYHPCTFYTLDSRGREDICLLSMVCTEHLDACIDEGYSDGKCFYHGVNRAWACPARCMRAEATALSVLPETARSMVAGVCAVVSLDVTRDEDIAALSHALSGVYRCIDSQCWGVDAQCIG